MNRRNIISFICLLLLQLVSSCEHEKEPEIKDILDLFSGEYYCQIESKSVNTDTWEVTRRIYFDTIEVTKIVPEVGEEVNDSIRKMLITGLYSGSYNSQNIVDLYLMDSSFQNPGDRVYGRFYFDSIYVHTQISPAALSSGTYIGKKIQY